MDIKEIKRRFDLLCKANNEGYTLLSELAKELKVSKTDLMQLIEDNSKLFKTGSLVRNEGRVNRKNLGLVVTDVYLSPEENDTTKEWLDRQIKEKQKYIHISEADDYGMIVGYYIEKDRDNLSKHNEHIWRNTQEKINRLTELGIIEKRSFFLCGVSHDYEFALTGEWMKALEENGWEHNELRSK